MSVEQCLDGHPPQRKGSVRRGHVHLVRWEEPRHPKVRSFQSFSLAHQNVAAGQISVEYSQTGQVFLWYTVGGGGGGGIVYNYSIAGNIAG